MHGYIQRFDEETLKRALIRSPVVVLLGPRQCGKSTLAHHLITDMDAVYLDLQDRTDISKLNEPELFFDAHRKQLVCLDEIQRLPEFFSLLRSEVDKDRRPGRFLLLGSASRDLIRQSSETLAGRIAFVDLSPFRWSEVHQRANLSSCWCRGGFPESLLAADDISSVEWRQDFIRTFLERDIPSLGLTVPIPVMERLWRLLAHYHGQTINYSKMAGVLDVATRTLKKYLAILEQTYMVRLLPPAESNLKKRLVKAPKVFLRDSGILHALLDIDGYDELLGHPVAGSSWEGFALEQIILGNPRWKPSFLRTGHGAEVDLIMERGGHRVVFEMKLSKAPKPSRGFYELVNDIQPDASYLIAPVDEAYFIRKGVEVRNLDDVEL